MSGMTVRIFLVDGSPAGIMTAEIINWTGHILKVPRSRLKDALDRREATKTGVYLLVGYDESVLGRPTIYVGESDNIAARLQQHASDPTKDFWDHVFIITSKDQNITKSHGLFLEAQIVKRAIAAGRCQITNIKRDEYLGLPESDIADMKNFLSRIEIALPVLGLEIFKPNTFGRTDEENVQGHAGADTLAYRKERRESLPAISGSSAIDVRLYDAKYGIEASGLESNGEVLVLAGSGARGVSDSAQHIYRPLRDALIREGKIIATGDSRIMKFAVDVVFNSPSAASGVILDRSDNGRASWKVAKTNQSLNEWYAEQAQRSSAQQDNLVAE
jgi:hypothetical protein